MVGVIRRRSDLYQVWVWGSLLFVLSSMLTLEAVNSGAFVDDIDRPMPWWGRLVMALGFSGCLAWVLRSVATTWFFIFFMVFRTVEYAWQSALYIQFKANHVFSQVTFGLVRLGIVLFCVWTAYVAFLFQRSLRRLSSEERKLGFSAETAGVTAVWEGNTSPDQREGMGGEVDKTKRYYRGFHVTLMRVELLWFPRDTLRVCIILSTILMISYVPPRLWLLLHPEALGELQSWLTHLSLANLGRPIGWLVISACTPSDSRGLTNLLATFGVFGRSLIAPFRSQSWHRCRGKTRRPNSTAVLLRLRLPCSFT
uniref:Uncharacterized protein n=1 Tax=Chromera velia CCMP2878 TaxID=1169474 RepID=A0A0G4H9G6_9ALVE|eukprot:Cvel_5918.t1-p1 / transcript=Cvel_5918.t1 / gene=Cvel_5918 / organism=Chromera_velia_CCMP2878 / gene_product=hypothetical protein / transcript_product=hypothetical protein / location=Cvel_scaffold283:34281-35492(-) / protein_length=310 / sequence_SO=supercontig / SO=protein_coding / is_pseudo=false